MGAVRTEKREQQAVAQLQQISLERNALKARLEQTKLAAADATCVRAQLRRATRDAETRSAASSQELQTAKRVHHLLNEERDFAERRCEAAQSELVRAAADLRS